jgi:hypothetical protein
MMPNVIIQNVMMLHVIIQNAMLVNVFILKCQYAECRHSKMSQCQMLPSFQNVIRLNVIITKCHDA